MRCHQGIFAQSCRICRHQSFSNELAGISRGRMKVYLREWLPHPAADLFTSLGRNVSGCIRSIPASIGLLLRAFIEDQKRSGALHEKGDTPRLCYQTA